MSAVEPGSSSVHVKGVVKVELDILDRVEMGRQLNGEVRLYSANNKVVFMAFCYISSFVLP